MDALYYATFESGTLGTPQLITQSPGISDPVITLGESGQVTAAWLESFADAVGVGYAVQDASGAWGMPQRLSTADGEMPWWLLPYVQDGELNIISLSRMITTDTGGAEGEVAPGAIPLLSTSGLRVATAPIGADLTVAPLEFVTSNPGTLRVESIVSNTGDLASDPVQVQLSIDGTDRAEQPLQLPGLAPGESIQVSFAVTEAVDPDAPILFAITADTDDVVTEKDESNNSAQAVHYLPNVTPQHIKADLVDGSLIVSGQVTSNGDSPTGTEIIVRLIADDPDTGDVLAETTIGALAVGESADLHYNISDARNALQGVRTAYLIVDATGLLDEQLEGVDNWEIVSLNPFDSWTNPDDRFDVGDNGTHSALDALQIVNELRNARVRRLPMPPTPGFFFDPNGDGLVSALDALVILNQLRQEYLESRGESESLVETTHQSQFASAVVAVAADTLLAPPEAITPRTAPSVAVPDVPVVVSSLSLSATGTGQGDTEREQDVGLDELPEIPLAAPKLTSVGASDEVMRSWDPSVATFESESGSDEETGDDFSGHGFTTAPLEKSPTRNF